MTQSELDRRVAAATGENLAEIRRRGFLIADPSEVGFDPEPLYPLNLIDWDVHHEIESPRRGSRRRRRSRVPA